MIRVPRKYEAIWNKIKVTGKCEIELHPAFIARAIKAVQKEKYGDNAFKFLNNHDHFYIISEVIEVNEVKSKITFILKQSIGIEGVKK